MTPTFLPSRFGLRRKRAAPFGLNSGRKSVQEVDDARKRQVPPDNANSNVSLKLRPSSSRDSLSIALVADFFISDSMQQAVTG
jgi:hypothetical protein